ncbi:MAG: hypothetical protein U9N55_03755, partial [candidate division Zixibacteria bacterium]|nr:hypothetical protein [candidate division Zixibacteria bacterium]
LRNALGAETLKKNIDGGIYKECSVGFTFFMPECSICGKDIRTCEHQPFEHYGKGSDEKICHFNYRQIERVLETSLVYRGATPETSISKELQRKIEKAETKKNAQTIAEKVISSPAELDANCRYLVTPYYDSLPVMVNCSPDSITITMLNGTDLPKSVSDSFTNRRLPKIQDAFGYLLGMRGKKRCSADQIQRFVEKKSSPVTRLEIRLFPREDIQLPEDSPKVQRFKVRMMRSCITDLAGMASAARIMSTLDGIRVWKEGEYPPQFLGYHLTTHPTNREDPNYERGYYTLTMKEETGRAQLSLTTNDSVVRFEIRQFNLARLGKGARFITDRLNESTIGSYNGKTMAVSGGIIDYRNMENGCVCKLAGSLKGVFFLQPIKLDDRKRFAFYRLSE